jgi:hypothetical protein
MADSSNQTISHFFTTDASIVQTINLLYLPCTISGARILVFSVKSSTSGSIAAYTIPNNAVEIIEFLPLVAVTKFAGVSLVSEFEVTVETSYGGSTTYENILKF